MSREYITNIESKITCLISPLTKKYYDILNKFTSYFITDAIYKALKGNYDSLSINLSIGTLKIEFDKNLSNSRYSFTLGNKLKSEIAKIPNENNLIKIKDIKKYPKTTNIEFYESTLAKELNKIKIEEQELKELKIYIKKEIDDYKLNKKKIEKKKKDIEEFENKINLFKSDNENKSDLHDITSFYNSNINKKVSHQGIDELILKKLERKLKSTDIGKE